MREEQTLLKTLFNVFNDRVGDVEDRLRAAKVLFQLDDLRCRKEFRKLQHVPVTGAAKRIDRLKLVADYSNVVVVRRHQFHDLRLKFVCVLILVHHDVAILVRKLLAQFVHYLRAPLAAAQADRRK